LRFHQRKWTDNPYIAGHCLFEAAAISNELTLGMGDKQGAHLLRSVYASAYNNPRVDPILRACVGPETRLRCLKSAQEGGPDETRVAALMAAEDAAEVTAATAMGREVDEKHWVRSIANKRASMMTKVDCDVRTSKHDVHVVKYWVGCVCLGGNPTCRELLRNVYLLYAGGNSSPQASIFLLGYTQTAKTEQAPRFSWLLLIISGLWGIYKAPGT
jgi:hypothetical protein